MMTGQLLRQVVSDLLHLHFDVGFKGLYLVTDCNERHDKVGEAEVVLHIRVFDSWAIDVDFKLPVMSLCRLLFSVAERLNCFREVDLDKRVAEELLSKLHQRRSINQVTALFTELPDLRKHLDLPDSLLRVQILLYAVPLCKRLLVFDLLEVWTHLRECLEDQRDCFEGLEVGCRGLLGHLADSFDV